MLQYDVKAKYRLISRKFSGMKYFLPERSLNQSHATRLYPFDKPIKSPYFRSFVVSVLFACFHFKVIRRSLYSFSPDSHLTIWIPSRKLKYDSVRRKNLTAKG